MATTTGKAPTRKTTTGETQMTDVQLREAVVQLLEREQQAKGRTTNRKPQIV